jgi:hypothetical protein
MMRKKSPVESGASLSSAYRTPHAADDAVTLAAIVLAVLLVVPAPTLVPHIPAIVTALTRVTRRASISAASIMAVIPHTTGAAE